jgi:hypothetical protein
MHHRGHGISLTSLGILVWELLEILFSTTQKIYHILGSNGTQHISLITRQLEIL